MERSKRSELKLLITRLAIVAAIVVVGIILYRWFFGEKKKDGYAIEDTPLHVEEIRKIIELNTIRFRDEVVVDTVEYYGNVVDQVNGNIKKLFDYDQAKHGISSSNVRRRLTMVVKGELLYGVDLKRKEFSVTPEKGKLIIRIPEPELLSISVSPKNTDIFVENGDWRDYERQAMQRKARSKMITTGERLNLRQKSKEPLEKLIKQLVRSNDPIVIQYY